MLSPMGTLGQLQGEKAHLSRVLGKTMSGYRPALRRWLSAYAENLRLLHFQSGRVVEAVRALRAQWPASAEDLLVRPGESRPRVSEQFSATCQRLRYDLSFECIALRMAYDSLCKVIAHAMPAKLVGQTRCRSFDKLVEWAEANSGKESVPTEVTSAVVERKSSFKWIRHLRDEFVHRTGRIFVVMPEDGGLACMVHGDAVGERPEGYDPEEVLPVIESFRTFLKEHFELAYEIEFWALSQERPRPALPRYITVLNEATAELYRMEEMNTFGVEGFLLGDTLVADQQE